MPRTLAWFSIACFMALACSHEEAATTGAPATPPNAGRTVKTADASTPAPTPTPEKKKNQPAWRWSDNPDLFPRVAIHALLEGSQYRLVGGASPTLRRVDADGTERWSVDPGIEKGELAGAAMVIDNERIYLAHYHRTASGCQLSAFRRTDGARVWSVRLEGAGPVSHSKYANRVQLGFHNSAPIVYGHESASRYIEVRDAKTGAKRHHESLDAAPLVRPLAEPLHRELATNLARRKSHKIAMTDFLARHNRPATDNEIERAAGLLHNTEIGGGAHRLRLEVTGAPGARVVVGKRIAAPAACRIAVTGIAEAQNFRGPVPIAPYQEAYYQSNPAAAKRRRSEGHGDHHLRCTYDVTVNKKRYRYPHHISNTGRVHDVGHCKTVMPTIAGEILSFTKACTDFKHGAFYGFRLEPVR